jgi:non-specific serine/threonine protein kinase
VRLAAAADNLRAGIGGTERYLSKRVQHEIDVIGRSLDPYAREVAYAAGKSSSLKTVIDYALLVEQNEDQTRAAETPSPADGLTRREHEVAVLVAEGLTNREIADRLVLTEKTAANHVARVFDKLGIHSRGQLAARAVDLGLRASTG